MNLKLTFVISLIFLFFTSITAFPTLGVLLLILLAYNYKIVCVLSLLGLTYNIGKIVKYYYERSRYTHTDMENSEYESVSDVEIGDGFEYSKKDDYVDFTFKNIKDVDGRQVNRLKFMREKFFKD